MPIALADHVLDEVGQQIDEIVPPDAEDPSGLGAQTRAATGTESQAPPEEQLREFREFIDEVSPEDFNRP